MVARYGGPKGARSGAFRSGLEERIAAHIDRQNVSYSFEEHYVKYTVPSREAKYWPDFVLSNGILIEGKGIFETADRQKQLLIREQYPDLDIRIVFSSSKSKLYKGSPTTYGMWCDKHGIKYSDKLIPLSWLKEPSKTLPEGVLIRKGEK